MKLKLVPFFSFVVALLFLSATAFSDGIKDPIVLKPSILLKHKTPYAGHGVAGDNILLFNIEIQPPDVVDAETTVGVYLRHFKMKVGDLDPVDSAGWTIPMSMKIESFENRGFKTSGTIFVLEVGLVSPTQPPLFHRLIKYGYTFSLREGFSHEVLDVGYLPMITSLPGELPNGLGLPENFDFVSTDDGVEHIVIADAIVGSVWSAEKDNLHQWQMQLVAEELAPTLNTRMCEYNGEMIVGFCGLARGPNWTVERYVQAMWQPVPGVDLTVGPFGLTYVGITDKIALNHAGTGEIFQIDPEVLLDSTLPPFTIFKPLETLMAPLPGVSDFQGSLVWDRWHPNTPWLYWQRILSTEEEKFYPIYRVNVFTAEVQFIAQSVMLFDHPSMISILPTWGLPFTSLVTSNTQERNMALTNRLITESTLVAPSLVIETRIWIPKEELVGQPLAVPGQ